ncbi:OmpA family protein [Alicycliphilus denitrificans]|uniref:OmpA family protein n=2 Tax=Alicycliphilus denitrificans TaxID=179636 RepID=A0A3R7FEF8_9BURK|nr:OmpA family protein [Alicycliphilus denitrificans]
MMTMQTTSRFFLRLLWLCAAALALGACQSPPTAAADAQAAARRAQVLREQGFVQTEDGWELQMSGKLLFDFNSDVMAGERREMLVRIGRALVGVGVGALRVEGHADDQGSPDYNDRLSLRRAQSVAQVLAETGIPRERIDIRGYGASRPLAIGTSETARQENRRVALIVPVQ